MIIPSIISDNITTGFITSSNLNYIISNIFSGNSIPELDAIKYTLHPSKKSNLDWHISQIQKQINYVCSSTCKKDYIINRISLKKLNKVNIDVHIQNSDNKNQFYFSGPDLKKYFIYLPKLGHYPHTGTGHSKWYGFEYKTKIQTIALNLKFLEILLFGINISDTYIISTTATGILGLEVEFTIPAKYESDLIINNNFNKFNSSNPTKVSENIFLYGKNGVNPKNTSKLLDTIRKKFLHLELHIFPTIITEFNLSNFINSQFRFALCSWNKHVRILVKSCKKIDVMIIDTWMNGLPRFINSQLALANTNIKIGFLFRDLKDQKSEGSCVFCALARLINLVDNSEFVSPDVASNIPIDNFYAYLVKLMYNNMN